MLGAANHALRSSKGEESEMRARRKSRELSVTYRQDRGYWVWQYFDEAGKRHAPQLGSLTELPTRQYALRRAHQLKKQLQRDEDKDRLLVRNLIQEYKKSLMFEERRVSTQRDYEVWLRRVEQVFGDRPLTDLRQKLVEEWLRKVDLAQTTKGHLRVAISRLWHFAAWCEYVDQDRVNPMTRVSIPGLTKPITRPAVNLTLAQFGQWIVRLGEPWRTIALVTLGCGLRISEGLALKWQDVLWLESLIDIRRSIVKGHVEDLVKSKKSKKKVHASPVVLRVLKNWRQQSRFTQESDWVFASPHMLGRKPFYYNTVNLHYLEAGKAIGLERISTHSMRHGCRSFLDALNTKPTIMRENLRHESISTTLGIYGAVVTDEERQAFDKLGALIDTVLIPAPLTH